MTIAKKPVYFHLGLEKTGSTFLQQVVLKNLIGVSYHRKSKFKNFERIIERFPSVVHFFSFETDRQLVPTAERIAKSTPEARIVLIIRRQDHWLRSKYNYHIRKHGTMTLREFFDLEHNTGFLKKEEFYYKPRIEFLNRTFTNAILYLDNEELKTNPERFIQRIEQYSGARLKEGVDIRRARKPAFSLKQNRILLAFNKFYPYSHLGSRSKFLNRIWYKYREFVLHAVAFIARFVPEGWVSKEPLVDEAYLQQVKEYFADDWAYACEWVNNTRN